MQDIDDTTLMCRVSESDDERAFAVLVARHQQLLLNFFIRWGVQYDCEDLVQQTFLRLYRYRHRYTPTARLTTFLIMMARQVWIDELRKRKRHQRLTQSLMAEPLPQSAPPAAASAGVGGDVDLARALAALPEHLRIVVELGVYQELPYAEVGAQLGIPVGTVKSRMFTALNRLRELLSP